MKQIEFKINDCGSILGCNECQKKNIKLNERYLLISKGLTFCIGCSEKIINEFENDVDEIKEFRRRVDFNKKTKMEVISK